MSPKPKPFEAFLAQRESGCVEWIGGTSRSNGLDSHRYGRYRIGGKKHLAHRVAYERAHGPIPAGLVVRHTCDNTLCCNPEHLIVGTQLENIHDAIRKGRFRLGSVPPRNRARGERSGMAKLTDSQIAQIRARRAAGETTVALASEFNCHSSHISRISRGVVRRI